MYILTKLPIQGYAMTQAVIRRPLTAMVRLRFQPILCGICGEQSGIGRMFLQLRRVSPVLIPQAPYLYLYLSVIDKIFNTYLMTRGVVIDALRYKPEGRGFDLRWCHWIFSLA
jgi:hypothetical protein